MRITKRGHACLDLDVRGTRVVIDPGTYSRVPETTGVDALVLTHAHADHADPVLVRQILLDSPAAVLFALDGTVAALSEVVSATGAEVDTVKPGDAAALGATVLAFTGGRHAPVHRDIDSGSNVGVLVDGTLYHPGDSFTLPDRRVPVLATPVGGPWLKLGEVLDFVAEVQPGRVLLIHDAFLSDVGMRSTSARLEQVASEHGGSLLALVDGESVEV
ncbi:MBL fold metallo-hydrolase [Ruania albidiflava]|uniref:MBL fold metallo-hydrolase n=1 Tax=Ruania albidiflava TaxID=366586 RepID=UPI0023F409CA|nr:MBL fold metallo-hydrolase [Ruania albidiflava]